MKKIIKNIYKTNYKNIDLLEDLKMSLLNFNFVMIYIIQKNWLKITWITLKIVFSNAFLRSITYNNGKFKSWRTKHN